MKYSARWRERLAEGLVIPAHPLALTAQRRLDERRQRALSRYYLAAGAGGLAVGVHTTQFAIRDPKIGLLLPVLELAAEELDRADARAPSGSSAPAVRIAGICGGTQQAVMEAAQIRRLNYHAGLLSLGAMREADDTTLLQHCKAVAEITPLIGFYLQPAAGGRVLSYAFWRRFVEIENVVAIKIAPFNRYQTLDVMRAVTESGRDDVVLYTGNDDNIVADLLTPHRFEVKGARVERRMVGGLLGHWAVWTREAVRLLKRCHEAIANNGMASTELLRLGISVTDSNAAFFDAANGFAGCIAGLHEILRRQSLLDGVWCLDPAETLSPGQREEIDRVCQAYPYLNDDAFVQANRDEWLRG